MGTKVIDLDEVLGEPKRIKTGGKTYTLPPDCPIDLYLEVNRAAQSGELGKIENIEMLNERLLELFQVAQPEMTRLPLSLLQCVLLIPKVYAGGDEGDDEGDEEGDGEEPAPPTPRTRGATSSKPRTRTRSRSSTSSAR